jgi:hypothetical protein
VPEAQIGGSVGRCSEFDRDFMPARASVKERWKRIDRAFHRDEELPPVSLYKVGGFYIVLDGHHSISVARYHGVEWINAEVAEFPPPGCVATQPETKRVPDRVIQSMKTADARDDGFPDLEVVARGDAA